MGNEGVAYLSHIPYTYILLLCEVIDLVAIPEHSNVFCSLTQSHHHWAARHHLSCTPGRGGEGMVERREGAREGAREGGSEGGREGMKEQMWEY